MRKSFNIAKIKDLLILPKKIALISLIVAIFYWSAKGVGLNFSYIIEGLPSFFGLLGEMFPPNWDYMPRLRDPLIETIQIAIIGTFLGALISIPLTLLAAHNITGNPFIYYIAKGVMNLLRTIPELLYASILVAGVGLGAFSGALALGIFSTVVISKLTSESLEAIDPGPLEALSAVGANKLELIRYAVIPQIMPAYTSYSLYVFEINIRVSTVLGLVGAGGIGRVLKTSLDLFRYQNAAMIILVTFLLVAVIDFISTRLRRALI